MEFTFLYPIFTRILYRLAFIFLEDMTSYGREEIE